eukprot:TRINITY_DN426_c0_g1_i1.p1 TRINITY_DN426_c0_g1~~TRINITY_DN426_c0_g1_i1.p1  ORF type:complete len:1736 (-),score=283.20 TRINITY_DN426_c0_g1_i1:26-5233(-)
MLPLVLLATAWAKGYVDTSKSHKHVSQSFLPDGTLQLLDYEISYRRDVGLIPLDLVASVQSVECFTNRLVVSSSSPLEVSLWSAGDLVLLGGSRFCQDLAADSNGIDYREIETIRPKGFDAKSGLFFFEVVTSPTSPVNFFHEAKVSFKTIPVSDQKLSPAELAKRYEFSLSDARSWSLLRANIDGTGVIAEKLLPALFAGTDGRGRAAIEVTCSDCFASVDVGYTLELTIKSWWGLPYLDSMTVMISGSANARAEFILVASIAYNQSVRKTVIPQVALPMFVISIGVVPIVIRPKLRVDAEMQLSLAASLRTSFLISYSKSVSLGTAYSSEQGGFRSIPPSTRSSFTTDVKLNPEFSLEADIRFFVIPVLTVEFYAAINFDFALRPYLGASVQNRSPSCTASGALFLQTYWGLEFSASLASLGFDLPFPLPDLVLDDEIGLPLEAKLPLVSSTPWRSFCLNLFKLSDGTVTYQKSLIAEPQMQKTTSFNLTVCPSNECFSWLCPPTKLGDGVCDNGCDTAACNYDNGDCAFDQKLCPPACSPAVRGNGICDSACNTVDCNYDDHDCCDDSLCPPSWIGDGYCDLACNSVGCGHFDGGDCWNPACSLAMVGDGVCDDTCNHAGSHFDGGDCCNSTLCAPASRGDGVCDTACNTETCNFDFGDCCPNICTVSWNGDGECDSRCNIFGCGYDGGDCGCPATCADLLNNGVCDPACNVISCQFDHGDCCPSSCVDDGVCDPACNTPSCLSDFGACCDASCMPSMLGDGQCDSVCLFCNSTYDGGDCIPSVPGDPNYSYIQEPDFTYLHLAGYVELLDRLDFVVDVPANGRLWIDTAFISVDQTRPPVTIFGQFGYAGNLSSWEHRYPTSSSVYTENGLVSWLSDPVSENSTFFLTLYNRVFNSAASGFLTTFAYTECRRGCPAFWLGDGTCDADCLAPECEMDRGDCAEHLDCPADLCPVDWRGDGECDTSCNVLGCSHDSGDCESICSPECPPLWLGDRECDFVCNTAACGFDGGDCYDCNVDSAADQCFQSSLGNGICDASCNVAACGFDQGDCTSSACVALGCPYLSWLGDGFCDGACFLAECAWDGGDCVGVPGGPGGCDCPSEWLGDGQCDFSCFNSACGFDKGDCDGGQRSGGLCPQNCTQLASNQRCDAQCNRPECNFDGGDCSAVACDASCLHEMLGNGDCDPECNNQCCGYDGGDCAISADPCAQAASCSECLLAEPTCGWCESTGRCMLGISTGPRNGVCRAEMWAVSTCYFAPPLSQLEVVGSLVAGAVVNVTWTGGPVGGSVVLNYRLASSPLWFTGLGLPSSPVANSGVYEWVVGGGFMLGPSETRLDLLVSDAAYSPNNVATLNLAVTPATLDLSGLPTHFYTTSVWSACSRSCGTGTQTRAVICRSASGAVLNNTACLTALPGISVPASGQSCTLGVCEEVPIAVRTPILGAMLRLGSSVTVEWSGGASDATVVVAIKDVRASESTPWTVVASGLSNHAPQNSSFSLLPSLVQGAKAVALRICTATQALSGVGCGIVESLSVVTEAAYTLEITTGEGAKGLLSQNSRAVVSISGLLDSFDVFVSGPILAGHVVRLDVFGADIGSEVHSVMVRLETSSTRDNWNLKSVRVISSYGDQDFQFPDSTRVRSAAFKDAALRFDCSVLLPSCPTKKAGAPASACFSTGCDPATGCTLEKCGGNDGLSDGAIAGAVIGTVAGATLLAAGVAFFAKRRRGTTGASQMRAM